MLNLTDTRGIQKIYIYIYIYIYMGFEFKILTGLVYFLQKSKVLSFFFHFMI